MYIVHIYMVAISTLQHIYIYTLHTQMFTVYAYMSTADHCKGHLLPPVEILRSWPLCYKPVYHHQTIPTSIHYYQPVHLQAVQIVVLVVDQDSYMYKCMGKQLLYMRKYLCMLLNVTVEDPTS